MLFYEMSRSEKRKGALGISHAHFINSLNEILSINNKFTNFRSDQLKRVMRLIEKHTNFTHKSIHP